MSIYTFCSFYLCWISHSLLTDNFFLYQVLDDKNVRRRFRASNYQSTTRVKPFICTMPMRLDDGWNQIQFNLSDFTRRAYGTNYIETLRVQVRYLLTWAWLRPIFDPTRLWQIWHSLALVVNFLGWYHLILFYFIPSKSKCGNALSLLLPSARGDKNIFSFWASRMLQYT